jgi:hypothetical protein
VFSPFSLTGIASAAGVIKGQPTARSDGSSITIHWDSDDETGIAGYEIARKGRLGRPVRCLDARR